MKVIFLIIKSLSVISLFSLITSSYTNEEFLSSHKNLNQDFYSNEDIKKTNSIYASIKKNENDKFVITHGDYDLHNETIAIAKYNDGMLTIGWDLLAIKTNNKFEDITQAEAAGYLEGYLTRQKIYNHWSNLHIKTWGKGKQMPDNVKQFLLDQKKFILDSYEEIKKSINDFTENKNATLIYNAYLLQRQFEALISGYNDNLIPSKTFEISYLDFHTISSFGDLFDIIHYRNTESRPNFDEMKTEHIIDHIHKTNHCSAIFKTKEDFTDIYFGHNSWFFYSASTRIFKEYNFNYNHPSIKSRNIIFSSYPATLASLDDFYITSQNLAIIETTNSLFNNDLFDKLNPQSLLCWQRAMISNRISVTALDWTQNFSLLNSGTYNNQFMVLDMKKIDLDNKQIKDGAMYIVEQIPGFCDINETTEYLRYGYWPSYNTPFSQEIKNMSNIEKMILKRPELKNTIDYDTCARANIFRRDQGKVDSERKFMQLIRYFII